MTTNTELEKIDKVLSKISGKELKDFVRTYAFTHEDLATALVEKYWKPERGNFKDICVAVAILNADNQVANNRHTRAITKELLVCRLRIILLSFYELVIGVNIIHLTLFQLTSSEQTVEK